jgi:hypothetical protein
LSIASGRRVASVTFWLVLWQRAQERRSAAVLREERISTGRHGARQGTRNGVQLHNI